MSHFHPASRAVLAAFGLALLSACAQTSPPPVIGHEEMRGGSLPAAARVPVTSARPDIATEPMRGGSLPPAGSGALTGGTGFDIGIEPMRGAPLPSTGDQRP
ncbi:hypothetical protein [Roseomonas indoligenes]|uniref:Argininosuccinate lyase n=1 Tax=Roseomonas indoligenes TaxID=2820811 RepID=A0A940S9C9_9PROT|nr:hypothetical protein [Pararoseomonas indoligenes]MBP0495133.1 hypothetical protein [Pararoseomonas indoligenes]